MSTGVWNTIATAAGLARPKKKFHFNVSFSLQDLRNCTYVSGLMFAKIRLKNGGSFSVHSDRSAVALLSTPHHTDGQLFDCSNNQHTCIVLQL